MIQSLLLFVSLFSTIVHADQPTFKGGERALYSFIGKNLIYPEYSKQNCLEGTINISFHLDRNGKITQSAIQKGMGLDLDDEALRIVRLTSGKWVVPVGYDTTYAVVIPINFSLQDHGCEGRGKDEIAAAINAYKARAGLTDAIQNFYKNKEKGIENAKSEAQIIILKQQLGYDEQFIDATLKAIKQKLKQGDKESACEDLYFIKYLGSPKADKLISENCK